MRSADALGLLRHGLSCSGAGTMGQRNGNTRDGVVQTGEIIACLIHKSARRLYVAAVRHVHEQYRGGGHCDEGGQRLWHCDPNCPCDGSCMLQESMNKHLIKKSDLLYA